MFSATLSKDIRAVCKKFMGGHEVYVDDEAKLTFTVCAALREHGGARRTEADDLLDALDFNQVVICQEHRRAVP